tara:strand:- start:397 stop:1161 length:765 start_codon:yes stop_codon:yes gene_type:complete
MNRIQRIFKNRSEKVIPFITAGFPNKEDTVNMVLEAERSGAAMIELGMPFSDPLADGPVIQEANQIAIGYGINIQWILDAVKEIRKKSEIPIALMGYINPILKYGLKEFMSDCRKSGVDGLIIPDLPPEEAEECVCIAKEKDISPILLVAPNTPDGRINKISKMAGTLIYCVSILGITGSGSSGKKELNTYLARVEKNSECAFVVGFGIKDRSDVVEINKLAHGAVIGSAIIKELKNSENSVKTIKKFIEKIVK